MDATFRPARPEDAEAFGEICYEAFTQGEPLEKKISGYQVRAATEDDLEACNASPSSPSRNRGARTPTQTYFLDWDA
ncbi:MAG TPA: hypothetical protein VEK15_11925 [Vicinamibacteria bacterium]|nr:hypothetical protein [Vicinamibacteria bacterium]